MNIMPVIGMILLLGGIGVCIYALFRLSFRNGGLACALTVPISILIASLGGSMFLLWYLKL